jgi:hypothetical protein
MLVAGLSLQRVGYDLRPVHVGFVVDKLTLGKVFLPELRFSLVFTILPTCHIRSFICHRRYKISAIESVFK